MIIRADCLDWLPTLGAESVDSCVMDPPAGISFMGREWDSDRGGRRAWVAWATQVFGECLRVCKPGAHGLVWALPRTSHWTAWALEDAGWEVRDVVHHIFGSGFPKSLDVSKTIDKAADYQLQAVIRRSAVEAVESAGLNLPSNSRHDWTVGEHAPGNKWWTEFQRWLPKLTDEQRECVEGEIVARVQKSAGWFTSRDIYEVRAPATPEAAQWDGWGTGLKPAVENWILVRKPLSEKTIAMNVLRWGTGALNIGACRIGTEPAFLNRKGQVASGGLLNKVEGERITSGGPGRWPANLVLSEDAAVALDEVVGERKGFSGGGGPLRFAGARGGTKRDDYSYYGDTGGPSRFFYCSKVSRAEAEAGLIGVLPCVVCGGLHTETHLNAKGQEVRCHRNNHPTRKPIKLMEWLCRLVTPPGGTVLDPFAGSGSTLIAAGLEGFDYLGCEKDESYVRIAEARLAHWLEQPVLAEVTV